MQFPGQGKPAVGIVFDTAFSHIDDALALALLFGFEGKKDVRVVANSVSRGNLKAAIYCDIVGRFYAGAVSGAIGFNGRTLPVGMPVESKFTRDEPLFTVPLAKTGTDGKPVYVSDIHRFEDTADANIMIRNALTAQYDANAIVVMAGPATNLADLLDLDGARDLIRRKVKLLVVAAGAYPDGQPEFNIQTDLAAAKRVFAEWPTPIVASGSEIGSQLLFPGASIENDFAWSPAHPVADAYRANHAKSYDAPTASMAAVLYASRPQENYFKLSEPGTIDVHNDGRTKFTGSPNGKHRYLILDPDQQERIVKLYTEVASAKPVPRPQRIPGKQQQQQNQDQKPAAK